VKYLFFLGNSSDLSTAEIESVFKQKVQKVSEKIVSLDGQFETSQFSRLGGVTKVAQIKDFSLTPESCLPMMVAEISNSKETKINFAVSVEPLVEVFDSAQLSRDLKNALEDQGLKARFVFAREGDWQLGSVVISKQHVWEFLILKIEEQLVLAQTVWVQEFESWGERDYGRPEVEGHLGMLPPKVARMMLNLVQDEFNNGLIVDPFCGTGTILAEGLSLGCKVIGNDLDIHQVERSKKNLEWLCEKYKINKTNFQVLAGPAQQISQKVKQPVLAVVTEPFLGPNNLRISPANVGTVNSQLINLYLSCLTDWKKLPNFTGWVVLILPSFFFEKQRGNLDTTIVQTIIDKANPMGYSLSGGPFSYFRSHALVRRNIVVFKLSK